MSVKIRLARAGAKKTPFYRIVAADVRATRDGRFIEILGRYNPRTEPSTIVLDVERVDAWLAKGAQMTEVVAKLYAIAKNPQSSPPVKIEKPSKKAQAKAAEEAQVSEEPSNVDDLAGNAAESIDAESTPEESANNAAESSE